MLSFLKFQKRISLYKYISLAVAASLLFSCSILPEKKDTEISDVAPLSVEQPLADESNALELSQKLQLEAEPEIITDLWERIRKGYQLPTINNPRIQSQFNWYAKHPDYIGRVSVRGNPYLYHIVEEIEARGMPFEIALLPIVESAFDPFAYSHGRAAGIWQIVPSTGKFLGLRQNWWYDGRRDIIASTNASLTYLQRLHKRFNNDWLLALAAYNSGPGNISKAIRKNKKRGRPTDYWNLKLSRETTAYVPKLIALSQLIGNPGKHNLTLPFIKNEAYFAQVDTKAQIDLAQAAELANLTMDELYQLNPAFNRWATDPGGPHRLLVPVAISETFKKELGATPVEERITWKRYKIRAGDTLSVIALKFKTNSASLKELNNLHSNRIQAGKTLMVPVASKSSKHYSRSATQRLAKKQQQASKNEKGQKITYKVKQGDSLWAIGKSHGVSARKVAKWNNMALLDPIKPGQSLVLWSKSPSLKLASSSHGVIRKLSYRVRKGDSLHRIADRFRLQITDILAWNHLKMSNYLQPGQLLTLFVDVTQAY